MRAFWAARKRWRDSVDSAIFSKATVCATSYLGRSTVSLKLIWQREFEGDGKICEPGFAHEESVNVGTKIITTRKSCYEYEDLRWEGIE